MPKIFMSFICIGVIAVLMVSDRALADRAKTEAVTECRVTVNAVLIYMDGSVNVNHSGRGDYTYICNLNSSRLGVSPTTCAMWTSMLQSLKRAGKRADFYYNLDSRFTSCADLPIYSESPAPLYVGAVE